jgi:Flp pilus assembly protein TadB
MSRRLQTTVAVVIACSLLVVAVALVLTAGEARKQTAEAKTQTCYLQALAGGNFQIAAYGSLASRSKSVSAITDTTKKAKDQARLKHDYRVLLAAVNRC